jgi:RHS repeat-associated protein
VLDANFGTRSATAIGNSRTYTGRQIDWETGLFYYRNRHYHAQLGNFVSRDPIGYAAGDPNLYRYVGNVPTVYVDPRGLKVYVAGRDLDTYIPPCGTHGFIIVIPDKPSDFTNLITLGYDKSGKPIRGFTVAGFNHGCLEPEFNNPADMQATRELFDRTYSSPWYLPDYSAELALEVRPATGETDTALIRRLLRNVRNYEGNTKDRCIEYQFAQRNCNNWLASLLQSLGVESSKINLRGLDLGHGKCLPGNPFQPRR